MLLLLLLGCHFVKTSGYGIRFSESSRDGTFGDHNNVENLDFIARALNNCELDDIGPSYLPKGWKDGPRDYERKIKLYWDHEFPVDQHRDPGSQHARPHPVLHTTNPPSSFLLHQLTSNFPNLAGDERHLDPTLRKVWFRH